MIIIVQRRDRELAPPVGGQRPFRGALRLPFRRWLALPGGPQSGTAGASVLGIEAPHKIIERALGIPGVTADQVHGLGHLLAEFPDQQCPERGCLSTAGNIVDSAAWVILELAARPPQIQSSP